MNSEAFEEFAAGFRGELLRPGDEGYDAARRVWNGMIDRRPAVIARCTGVADVVRAVNFARSNDLLVAIRGGGHSVAGNGVCDDGVMIDLSPMRGVRVDPSARAARAQPGVTWGLFDRETNVFGFATTGGLVSTTGIAGLTLGGGVGWLARRHGVTADNLLSADVVTASGDVLTASERTNEELFWGLRGGGGNFGVVTSFEYRLRAVDLVLAGAVFHPGDDLESVLRFFRDFVADAPDELTVIAVVMTAPPFPFLPEHAHGKLAVALAVCCAGDLEKGESVLRPLREFGQPLADVVGPMPYPALQSMFDGAYPSGLHNYWKSNYLNELSDDGIAVVAEHARQMPPPTANFYFEHLGGAIARGGTASAFGHRDARFDFSILTSWADPEQTDEHLAWTRGFWEAMQPHAAQSVYVNNLGAEGEDRVRAAYAPEIYDRLIRLKDEYDPDNLFRLNQNIRPSAERAGAATS
ncbi:MAG: FAD-binding oxidoreductase [Geminicoccales bacterium]